MKRRIISIIMVVTMIAATMVGCGKSSNKNIKEETASNKEENNASGDKKEISMWFWGASEDQQKALQSTLVDNFNETHPEYNLTIEYRASVNKDMSVALAANEGPDIVYESSPSLAMSYVEAGKYADLSTYSEKYGWKDKLIQPMYDSSTVNGKLYSIPMGLNVIGVVYNQRVLDENGWEVPKSLDEMTNIMDEAIAKGMYGSVTGNSGWRATNEDYASLFLNSFAGPDEVYKCLVNEQKWNSTQIKAALETSAEWYKKGYLCSEYTNIGWGEAASLLATGQAPFFFGPLKFIQNLSTYAVGENKDDFQFTVFPAGREGVDPTYTIGATGLLAINENSKYKDACAEFLDMFMSTEFVMDIAQGWPGYWGVPLKELGTLDISQQEGLAKSFLKGMGEACVAIDEGNFGYYCSSFIPPKTFEEFVAIDTVWFGETTTDELLNKVDSLFAQEFESGLIPPVPAQK